MSKKTFDFGDVLGFGWRTMTSNLLYFVGVGFLYLIIAYLPNILMWSVVGFNPPEPVMRAWSMPTQVASQLIGIILAIGMYKIALRFCDEQKPGVGTLLDSFDCFWRYLGFVILYVLIIIGGLILFIVPGIIWAIRFSLGYYFVIDEGLGPIDALKASTRATQGVKGELFCFAVISTMIMYAGMLCLGVGIFAAYPTVVVAKALIYRQLSAQTFKGSTTGIEPVAVETQSDLRM